MDKASFLKNELAGHIKNIPAGQLPAWGKMNLQQMTEHLGRDAFRVASGKITFPLMTPEEHLPKMQAFIQSEIPFKENTVNRLMAAEPLPEEQSDMPSALAALQEEIDHFFSVYAAEPGKKVINPFFGELDYEMQVQLLHKHALHHLKQFGVTF